MRSFTSMNLPDRHGTRRSLGRRLRQVSPWVGVAAVVAFAYGLGLGIGLAAIVAAVCTAVYTALNRAFGKRIEEHFERKPDLRLEIAQDGALVETVESDLLPWRFD